ncbi:MarR family winged helix-turn-helix transcriptional regulator [Nostocoides sp. F2B08]|uniref:MarR family winged helix-turn-helix transcriptional regulator n=1 Tax=Nostocoides sp. F2B08 TaxID=2653936 RepID=UPI00186B0D64|nr:MarR family transcriptional regulator [Tetrasphaera sp. F2B08]
MQPTISPRLGDELVRVLKLMQAARSRWPGPAEGLDSSAFPILFVLSREPQRVSEIADTIHSDVSTVSRQVAGLIRSGFVDRTPDPEDRRAQVLTLTQDGRDIIATHRRLRDEWLSRLVGDWPDEDLTALTNLLARFGDSLQDHLGGPQDGIS